MANPATVLAAIIEGVTLAGPLIARFGLAENEIVTKISSGLRSLMDILDRLREGAEDYAEQVDELVAEFRQLKEDGGVTPEALRAKAESIETKTAALRAAVEAARNRD